MYDGQPILNRTAHEIRLNRNISIGEKITNFNSSAVANLETKTAERYFIVELSTLYVVCRGMPK